MPLQFGEQNRSILQEILSHLAYYWCPYRMNDNKGAGSHLDNSLNPNQNAASRTKDSTVPCVQTAPQVSAMLTTEVKPGVQDNTDPSPSSTPKITTIHRSSSRSGKHPYEGSGGRKASSSVRDGLITGLTPTQRPSRAKKGLRVHNCTHPGCEKVHHGPS